ncbi:hypothetical protein EDD21DRAFT_390436 [Dissophora ornata]|nr:hypothetical protein BGZ58_008732 [Dissophora ornata]KAI8595718.1 hypothetical protein EDD21DRAFT_390436 [Dissophora ornata]
MSVEKLPRVIFLDSGGVINDNERRAPQWVYHLQEYMPQTKIGGPGAFWGRANAILSERLFKGGDRVRLWDQLMAQSSDFEDFDRRYLLYWMQTSLQLMNEFLKEEYDLQQQGKKTEEAQKREGQSPKLIQLSLPATEEEQIQIARDAHMYCTARVQADYPGAVEAILNLKFEQGFDMYTCSGESAPELELTLRTLGISTLHAAADNATNAGADIVEADIAAARLRPVFTKLYGPDLIQCHKSSSQFYELIFKDSGVDPRDAVVVDDKEYILAWAKIHGARTVMISSEDRAGKELEVEVEERVGEEGGAPRKRKVPAVDHQLNSLAELPALTALWKELKSQGAKEA